MTEEPIALLRAGNHSLVSELYADIISEAALEILGKSPVETLCRDCKTPEECLPFIQNFMDELKYDK